MEPKQQNTPVEKVPHTPNQHSHFLPMLVVGVLMLLVGFGGGYLLFGNKSEIKQTELTQISPTTVPTMTLDPANDPTSNWKTYESEIEGFSFKYPGDWVLKNALTPQNTLVEEFFYLEGPNNFRLSFDVYKTNDNSNFGCYECVFNGVTPFQPKNLNKQLFIVVNSRIVNNQPFQVLSLSEYTNLQSQPIKSWPYYKSNSNKGYVVRWAGQYTKPAEGGDELVYSTYNDFIKMPEVEIAKLILQSLTY